MSGRRTALVCGAGGFVGGHMVRRLEAEGYRVVGVDIKQHEFMDTGADRFVVGDLRDPHLCRAVIDRPFDEVYQFAADMGGAGFVFSGEHDADIMHNSALINLNVIEAAHVAGVRKVFYSSSACMYPEHAQTDTANPGLSEDMAYPASPDSDYGWEKLFSERLYLAFARNYGMDVRIARFHNVFGPYGSWGDGREKAPAAFCRKVAETPDGGEIEMWGDGEQTRSFLYIDDCLEGVRRLVASDFAAPVNIGSEEMVSINQLARMVMEIAGKEQTIRHVPGPLGVRGRKSNNDLAREKLGWEPRVRLREGLERTYAWVAAQVTDTLVEAG